MKAFNPEYSEELLGAGVDLLSEDVVIAAMDSAYVYSDAHNFADDLSSVITTSAPVTGKTATEGWFDFDDLSLGTPAGGDTITQCWLYVDSGSPATSRLVYYWSEDEAGSPLSVATDGTDVNMVVPTGGLFRV